MGMDAAGVCVRVPRALRMLKGSWGWGGGWPCRGTGWGGQGLEMQAEANRSKAWSSWKDPETWACLWSLPFLLGMGRLVLGEGEPCFLHGGEALQEEVYEGPLDPILSPGGGPLSPESESRGVPLCWPVEGSTPHT